MPCATSSSDSTIPGAARVIQDNWDATQIPSLQGKVAIVTGANSGIGYVTALELARHGADVVLACRNPERSAAAAAKIRDAVAEVRSHGRVEEITLDTSEQRSVKAFCEEFLRRHQKLDILVNNAGAMGFPYTKSADGFELMVATNHLGHFTLTATLMGALRSSPAARVVNVSSDMHRWAKYTPGNLFMLKDKHNQTTVYGNSKLYNLLFTWELGRRLQAAGVSTITAVACHPGSTDSSLLSNAGNQGSFLKRWFYGFLNGALTQSTAMGALPTLYAATAADVKNADYFGPGGFAQMKGYPSLQEPSELARSREAAADVWTTSEALLGFKFEIE